MASTTDILNARILIVDDLEFNVRVLDRILRNAGYTSVASTMDPLEVCALHRENHYDLILLDIQMPGMDGFQVMEGLKEIELDDYLPVIVITSQPDYKLRALQLGAKDFISTPFDLAEVLARVHNMLEVRLYNELLTRLNAELEQRVAQRTAQLEAANKELEEFSYSMSHVMRTPMLALDGFSKILLEEHGDRLDDEGKRLLKVLRDNAQRMGRLIDDILHFLSMGMRRMEFSSIDIAKLVSEILTEFQTAAPARRFRLEIGSLPQTWGDRDMIREALQNLLSNAIKFTPADAEAVIVLGGVTKEDENVYSVKDRGVGFDMHYADKLFRVFERVHQTGQYEGSGIGLALVKRIITRHGGRVWAEGKINEGSTFYFALPTREKEHV